MNRLFIRSLAIGLGSIAAFVLVVLLVISAGLPGILAEWERSNDHNLNLTVTESLEKLSASAGPDEAAQESLAAAVRDSLRNLPVRPEYLVVLDRNDRTVFLNHLGDDPPGPGTNLIRRLVATAEWHSIRKDGQPWLRYAAKVLPFDADESNSLLFSAVRSTALWATAAASLIAFVIAWLLSRPLSRQARAMAAALAAMQAGQRDIAVPRGGVRELDAIAASTGKLQDSLRREEQTRQQWASDIAHDLRTPLTVLKGQFEGMLDGVLAIDRPRLQRNYQEIRQLENLIAQLAELTKLETPGFRPILQPVEVVALLTTLAGRFADTARKRGFSIAAPASGTAPCTIQADAALLDRALSNLIENALAHGEPGSGSPVRLSMECHAGTVSLAVSNAGLIAPELLPRLFDRLFRADSSRGSAGSGLGLAIVKAIAESHCGSAVAACNESARLSTFTITLPAGIPG